MTVCIGTSVLIQAARPGHRYEAIITAWFRRRFQWAISTSILAEYEEVLTRRSGPHRWRQLTRVFDLADRRGDLLIKVSPAFQFRIISVDPDDSKFTDCAITIGADFVVTEDKHFAALAGAGYKPMPISPMEFIDRLLGDG